MMHLILTACLTIPSFACREEAVTIFEPINELQCAMTAPMRIASWSESHPDWRVVRWRCKYEIAQRI